MAKQAVVNELRTLSYVLEYSDLVNAAVGVQDGVEIHEILPEGWEVSDAEVETEVAFNGTGTRALDLGVTGDGDAIIDGLDVKAAGIKAPTVVKYRAASAIAVIANLITATDNPTAGTIRITLFLAQVRREN